ncbi:MAG: hypothetical protein JW850_23505 [Thermoflexales bacterium]|nr:hypothetical protein [Thermoflexales bacterium]
MKDIQKRQARFMRDAWPVRLGNLASNLLRLSNWAQMRHSDQAIIELLRESAWFIEWTADDAPADSLLDLANVQRELCLWRRTWPLEAVRPLLALRARVMSEHVLELSGLLQS